MCDKEQRFSFLPVFSDSVAETLLYNIRKGDSYVIYSLHKTFDETGALIKSKPELVDEKLYDLMKTKKEKLISQIKAEKVTNPTVAREADKAIENIRKQKCGSGRVGSIAYTYESVKGIYFYLHKVISKENSYVDSLRYYSVAPNGEMLKELLKDDSLYKREKL